MWATTFDPVKELAAVQCPACSAVGFVPVDSSEVKAADSTKQLREYVTMCPSVPCRCAACGAVGEWPNFVPWKGRSTSPKGKRGPG
jgi:hypothetical protein